MKNLKIILSMCALSIVFSCKTDDDQIVISPVAETPVPALTSIQPNHGPKNTLVTIKGSDFGNDKNRVMVSFNDVQAAVSSVTETEIKVKVPSLALTGQVKVVIEDKELIGSDFTYEFSEAHVSTLAGNREESGYQDGIGSEVKFGAIDGIAKDGAGNIYIAEPINNSIRKIDSDGKVTTILTSENGYVDGPLEEAKVSWPNAIEIDATGNIYFVDTNNYAIRKISPEGMVSTIAGGAYGHIDGPSASAAFLLLQGIAVDDTGNIYVSEFTNDFARIRKISSDGIVSTIAGGEKGFLDGQGTEAKFDYPGGLEIDSKDNIIIADRLNNKIRKINSVGVVSTIAGSTKGHNDGHPEVSKFNLPYDIAIDKSDNIFVSDYNNWRIRKISSDGMVTTLAGNGNSGTYDGEGLSATLIFPRAVVADDNFNLFVTQNNTVRKIAME